MGGGQSEAEFGVHRFAGCDACPTSKLAAPDPAFRPGTSFTRSFHASVDAMAEFRKINQKG